MICRFNIRSYFFLKFIVLIGFSILFGNSNSYAQDEQYQQLDSLWMLSWNSEWDDALHEFKIVYETPTEEDYGELLATWAHLEDWTQWEYSIGDYSGSIWQKWPRRDDEWELRSEGNITTITNRWRNDNSEVVINYNNEIKLIWKSKSFNDGNVWVLEKNDFGEFEFFTEFVDDPRDWLIYDDTALDLPLDVKVACCFIALYRTTAPFRR